MASPKKRLPDTVFQNLTPDKVISLVEKVLGRSCTNLCRPLNSYINRVYELRADDDSGLIAKFYRPRRWSKQALQDEHDFLLELQNEEIPVVAPLVLQNGDTLAGYGDMYFAVFPKKGGRSFDEYNDEQWLEIGRLLGRIHMVGVRRESKDRIVMKPDISMAGQIDYLLGQKFIPPHLTEQFKDVTGQIIATISSLFVGVEMMRIHGDCHFANLLYRPNESFHIVDFDDMAIGPPVQDFWMLLPGYMRESLAEIEIFLEGYETFRAFDRRTLNLIEPLRAMRYIHYIAWCARQVAEDGFSHVAPDFGTAHYWQREINDLQEQFERIRLSSPQR